MKTLVTTAIIFCTFTANTFAQGKSEEKIILQDSKLQSEVQIEIKDGNIYVDGKKVAPYNVNRNLKIIKKLGKMLNQNDAEANMPNIDFKIEGLEGNMPSDDAKLSNKAMLGVSTEVSKTNDGAVVNQVNANTPAAKVDLQEGDVITKVDRATITTPQDLATAISNYKPGDKVVLLVKRNGKELTKNVTLAASNADDRMGNIFGGPNMDMDQMMEQMQKIMKGFGGANGESPFGGLEEIGGNDNFKIFGNKDVAKSNTQPKLGAQLEERADGRGLRVVSVKDGSTAQKAGLLAEDVVRSLGGNNTNSLTQLSEALKDVQDKKDIVVSVLRNGKEKTLYLQLEKQLHKKDF